MNKYTYSITLYRLVVSHELGDGKAERGLGGLRHSPRALLRAHRRSRGPLGAGPVSQESIFLQLGSRKAYSDVKVDVVRETVFQQPLKTSLRQVPGRDNLRHCRCSAFSQPTIKQCHLGQQVPWDSFSFITLQTARDKAAATSRLTNAQDKTHDCVASLPRPSHGIISSCISPKEDPNVSVNALERSSGVYRAVGLAKPSS
jgi:hypothetical protein